jgi:hypothetical protein
MTRKALAEVGVTATQKLPADQWVNLVTTIDGKTISYYLNGAKIGTSAATLDLAATMYSAANTTSGFLGKPFWGGHPSSPACWTTSASTTPRSTTPRWQRSPGTTSLR